MNETMQGVKAGWQHGYGSGLVQPLDPGRTDRFFLAVTDLEAVLREDREKHEQRLIGKRTHDAPKRTRRRPKPKTPPT